MSVRSVSVNLRANISQYTRAMGDAAKQTKAFRDELAETASKGQGDLDAVANGALAFGAALGGALAIGIGQAIEFDHAMAQVNAVSNATASEFEAMRQAAIDMGAATKFSATEAAQATEELAKAGLNAAQITGGALAGALSLAAAGGIGLAEAATIAANTLNQFNLAASEMSSIADTLAGSANASSTDVTGLGESLKNVGTVAAQAGLTVEETVGILSAFGDNALVGAEAGTALKTTLLRLMAPTGAAKDAMDDLGISIYDSSGNALSAVEIVRNLENGLSRLSVEQRMAAINTIFGAEAIAGANIILKEGSQGISEYIEKVSEEGVAAETAAKRMDSLKGDVDQLTSALEGLAIESSGGVSKGLRVLVEAATDLVQEINDLPSGVTATAFVIGTLTAAGLLAFGAITKLRGSLALMNTQLAATGPAGSRAATALSKVGTVAGGIIGTIAALKTAATILSASIDEDLNPQVDALGVGLERWAKTGELSGEAARVLGDDFEGLAGAIGLAGDKQAQMMTENSGNALVDWFSGGADKVEDAKEKVEALDAALAQMHTSGNTEGANQAFMRLGLVAKDAGLSVDEMITLFPQYQAALETTTEKTSEATEAINPYTLELTALASQFNLTGDDAEQAVTQMLDAWSEGATSFIDLLGVYQDALGELDEGQKVTAESFIQGLREQVEAQQAWADNMTYLASRVPAEMLDELARMGPEGADMVALMREMTDEELQETVELWGQRGDQVGQEIADGILEGTDSSIDGLNNMQDVIDTLHGANIKITVTQLNQIITREFGINANQVVERWGGVTHHARTGLLREAGIYGPVSPARYAFAESATGGEAFIPRLGNEARSMAILSEAASWYGADVVPDGRYQWRGQKPVTVIAPEAEEGRVTSKGRRFGQVYVERQEVAVHAHTDTFGYQQTMDELAWHGVH